MQTDSRAVAECAARDLLTALSACEVTPTIRVAEVEGHSACLILVWDARQAIPTIGAKRRRPVGARADCKAHILEVIRSGSQPQTRKEVVKALRAAGKQHGAGTVAKALADLTATGELVNPKDKKGYRLQEWMRRRKTPSLFD